MYAKRFILFLLLFLSFRVYAVIEKIPAGSFILNLGIKPQTIGNGLKPYGLVYDLLQTYKVPVSWIINPTKKEEGVDFAYKGENYRGGSFVVPAQYRTAEVNAAISKWKSRGVVGEDIDKDLDLPVYAILTYAPRWTLDRLSADLVIPFFENAGIPSSAFGGTSPAFWKLPADLSACDDIFVLPHSDPSWASHHNLLNWNKEYKGAIWSGCHAVSVLENLMSPDGLSQMNFLTTGGLVNYMAHTSQAPPYMYSNPADAVMQFMETMDIASYNGSESIYLPKPGSYWRSGTKTMVKAPNHPDIPLLSPGPAVVMAYGRGFDDPSRGWIMYQGGHFHNGVNIDPFSGWQQPFGPSHIALQRAFFNFSFLAVIDRQANGITAQINAAEEMNVKKTYPVTFTVPDNIDISKYQVNWSASTGSIVPDSHSEGIQYIPPTDPEIKIALLTLTLTDICGREYFNTFNVRLNHCETDNGIFSLNAKDLMEAGQLYDVSLTSTSTRDWGAYNIEWSASEGKIINDSSKKNVQFLPSVISKGESITLNAVLTDSCGFVYSAQKIIAVNKSDSVRVPKLISANNDGYGYDFLYIENIEKYPNNELLVFNRWGNLVYTEKKYDNQKKAFAADKSNSIGRLMDGVYYYILKLNPKNNTENVLKGYFILKH